MNGISLVTAHGIQDIPCREDQRIIDALIEHQIPWSAISLYQRSRLGGPYVATTGLDKRISEFPPDVEIYAFYQRNVDPFIFRISDLAIAASLDGSETTTEFLYRNSVAPSEGSHVLKKFSAEECRAAVRSSVHRTLSAHLQDGEKLVVGVSGGGDSNALLHALSTFTDFRLDVHPVILKGLPEWDSGVARANELCEAYGYKLTVIEEREIRKLLSLPSHTKSLPSHFSHHYPEEDFEFFGVYLIGAALVHTASGIGARYVCKGANLEDLLGDSLYMLMNGINPRTLPVYRYRDKLMITPLWLLPKKIIDGCFPEQALTNYRERHACTATGRSLAYQISYSILSQYPQVAERILRGMARYGEQLPEATEFDTALGFEVFSTATFPSRQRAIRMLQYR